MTVKGGTSQACAACKYQRRKCTADCALAPYFPPDKPRMFENAHRLFGVSNIVKILKQLKPNEKNDAMYSIKFQAFMREKFPVHGCYGYICQLRFQIEQIQQELNAINHQLVIYRHQHQQNHLLSSSSSPHQSPSAQLQLGMATSPTSSNSIPFYHHSYDQNFNAGISLDPTHGNNVSNNPNAYLDSKENIVNPLWIQNQNPYASNFGVNSAAAAGQSPLLALPFQQELTEVPRDYNEIPETSSLTMKCFSGELDERQIYIRARLVPGEKIFKLWRSVSVQCNRKRETKVKSLKIGELYLNSLPLLFPSVEAV